MKHYFVNVYFSVKVMFVQLRNLARGNQNPPTTVKTLDNRGMVNNQHEYSIMVANTTRCLSFPIENQIFKLTANIGKRKRRPLYCKRSRALQISIVNDDL